METLASRELEALLEVVAGRRIAVLTGAGISTESGIPDYRGPTSRPRRRSIEYRPFVDRPEVRARYWARSMIGWPRFRAFAPNPAHRALVDLERGGCLTGVITQNVDRLHSKAGASRITELHGALADIRCLDCGMRSSRDGFQERLILANPELGPGQFPLGPDGDAELPDEIVAGLRVPACRACGGILKPDVVFFGESVPPPRVAEAFAVLESAEALLIVGSSLAIHSGFRFLQRAHALGLPVALVNLGACRGAERVQVHIDLPAGIVLSALAKRLLSSDLAVTL